MHVRLIKPQFFSHFALWKAERESGLPLRLAYAGLWCAADREGRFKWEPQALKAQVLPFDSIDFERVLEALLAAGFLVRYRAGPAGGHQQWIGAVASWADHQSPHRHERASHLPGPGERDAQTTTDAWVRYASPSSTACKPSIDGASTACMRSIDGVQDGVKERKGKERSGGDASADGDGRRRVDAEQWAALRREIDSAPRLKMRQP